MAGKPSSCKRKDLKNNGSGFWVSGVLGLFESAGVKQGRYWSGLCAVRLYQLRARDAEVCRSWRMLLELLFGLRLLFGLGLLFRLLLLFGLSFEAWILGLGCERSR